MGYFVPNSLPKLHVSDNDDDAFNSLRQAIQAYGLSPPDTFVIGDWARCEDAQKGKSNKDGSYHIWPEGTGYRAVFKSWRRPEEGNQYWNSGDNVDLTEEDLEELDRSKEQQRQQQDSEYAQARLRAVDEWNAAKPCEGHPYLTKKNVPSQGLRSMNGMLLIPMMTMSGQTWSLQRIDNAGDKRFMTGGKAKGMVFVIGVPLDGEPICAAEGYATGASIHRATGWPVIVTFSANNMVTAAPTIKQNFPNSRVLFCGDNDNSGTGQKATKKAAAVINGGIAIPPVRGDWNDHEADVGTEDITRLLKSALAGVPNGPVPLDAASRRLSAAVNKFFEDGVGCMVVKATTGLGKSRAVRNAAASFIRKTG
jgi:putative DNA primase/helicase